MSASEIQQHIARGDALYNARRFADAADSYHEALKLDAGNAQALNNLGNAYKGLHQYSQAADCYRRAIALRPDVPQLHFNLANVLVELGDFDEAIAESEICLRALPDFADAHRTCANALRSTARLEEAIEHLRRAGAASDLLYLTHFQTSTTPQSLFDAHRQWGRQFDPAPVHALLPRGSRIRLGYVSPDFRAHCQANFLLPLLSHHDKSRFEIFAYGNMPDVDAVGERLLSHVEHRRSIFGVSDAQADAMIRADQIDILVDLTLHMPDHRLSLFARKPAPVQITWLGYPSTTGLAAMHYRLSDSVLDPPGETDAFYTEKTIRLPDTFWCYDPMSDVPAQAVPPVVDKGFIKFGCLNNFAKVTAETLDMWAQVMNRVPKSELILLAPHGSARTRVLEKMGASGIAKSRIHFVDRCPRNDYLLLYSYIDIALDTFPCTGHTTTLDALWMAVPVVTCTSTTAISRGAASILHCIGLDELIAHSDEDFVARAASLASDVDRLKTLRSNLRERVERSPLMDASRFARNIETVYERVLSGAP